ncbi:MAG: hypothetical protein ACJAZ2_000996 [Glaciecola sp.]|jgi:hypothetical protein
MKKFALMIILVVTCLYSNAQKYTQSVDADYKAAKKIYFVDSDYKAGW